MKRRFFLLTILSCIWASKSFFANNKSKHELIVKDGWILKEEDI